MSEAPRVAGVTGASGYLGSRICETLEARGWRVIRLVRTPRSGDPRERPYDLSRPLAPDLLESVDLLVHAAYDFSLTGRRQIWKVNVDGARRLLEAACEARVQRIMVLSTMSAYEGTRQLYGRAKLAIETATLAAGGFAIRPGLVYGPQPGGMVGALRRVTRLPVVPLLAPNARQYPVREEDLMTAIAALAEAKHIPDGPIGIAQSTPIRFHDLLVALAGEEGRRCRFVPIPWPLAYWGLRAAELLRIRLPFRADSLLGLVRPAAFVPGVDELARLGIRFTPFSPYGEASGRPTQTPPLG
jgi:nucleoside-diphosphate-sugar epimerase